MAPQTPDLETCEAGSDGAATPSVSADLETRVQRIEDELGMSPVTSEPESDFEAMVEELSKQQINSEVIKANEEGAATTFVDIAYDGASQRAYLGAINENGFTVNGTMMNPREHADESRPVLRVWVKPE